MAQGKNEHRMVFDIRGRRGYVVKVVYALLALLMVASLFLVTGAINLNSLLGLKSTTESATSGLEEQAENVEAKLAKSPGDEDLLASLTRSRINIANTMINTGKAESQSGVEEIEHQLALGSEDWSNYLAAAKEPSAGLAIQAAPQLHILGEVALSNGKYAVAVENFKGASEAQQIVTEQRPNLNSWSTLAYYALYAQEFKVAEEAKEEALKLATSKFQREDFENEYEKVEKAAKEIGQAVKSEEAGKSKSGGKESLENPLGGLGGSTLGGE